ncbi:hypothetical protein ACJQWK_10023 [Exserohilum turcicum]
MVRHSLCLRLILCFDIATSNQLLSLRPKKKSLVTVCQSKLQALEFCPFKVYRPLGQKLFVLPLSGYLAYHLAGVCISAGASKLYRVSTVI